ncbi:MAG: ABC transporter permease [Lawsonibacter sp.]|nr:ABC transporter permease [Lawsonibacter sp.]MCI9656080.1 ABC transporter permease [Lawsonibacter sp.]
MAGEVAVRYFRKPLAVLGAIILAVIVIMCLLAPVIAPYDYDAQDVLRKFTEPCRQFPCGTDNLGRDIFSRLLYGGRISLMVGFVSATVAAVAGVVFGAIAAFYGGKVDNLIMRFLDIFIALPQMLLAIVISTMIGPGIQGAIIAVTIATIPRYAQAVRAPILSIRGQEFVEAAFAIDARDSRIILRHILPNVLSPIIVQVTMGVGNAITMAASLSFLGLGVQPPYPEWGQLISSARVYILDHAYMVTYPGLAIAAVVLALNLMGDGLRDAMDPRWKD